MSDAGPPASFEPNSGEQWVELTVRGRVEQVREIPLLGPPQQQPSAALTMALFAAACLTIASTLAATVDVTLVLLFLTGVIGAIHLGQNRGPTVIGSRTEVLNPRFTTRVRLTPEALTLDEMRIPWSDVDGTRIEDGRFVVALVDGRSSHFPCGEHLPSELAWLEAEMDSFAADHRGEREAAERIRREAAALKGRTS